MSLAKNGLELDNGQVLKFVTMEKHMTGDEIFEFIDGRLKIEEEVTLIRKNLMHVTPQADSRVQEVGSTLTRRRSPTPPTPE